MGAASNPTAKRQRATLIALAVALLAVGCLARLATSVPDATDEDAAAEPFLGVTADEVTAISWTHDGATSEIVREDGNWTSPAEPDASVDQNAAGELATALADATVERTIDGADEAMGLDDPTWTVTVSCSDGTAITAYIGNATSDGSSYYTRIEGKEAVFVIGSALATELSNGVSDLYVRETPPGSTDLVSLTLAHDGTTVCLSYSETGWDELYSADYLWKVDDGSGAQAADSGKASTLASLVNHVNWTSCVDPVADDGADYGFDAPTLTATLAYEASDTSDDEADDGDDDAETFTVEIGNRANSGGYYARIAGSQAVYTISADDVQDLLDASAGSLAPDDVCLMDWDTVMSLDVTVDGKTFTIEFSRSAEGDGEDADVTTAYVTDGEDADADKVEELLDSITALSAEGEADDASASEEPAVSFAFRRSTVSFSEMTLSFARYDNSFYLATLDGQSRQLVNRNDVAELEELARALAN